jgi:DNA repair protein RadA/Sms
MPGDMIAIGEVGLAGEVRRVSGVQRRLSEAERMGFRRALVPPGSGGLPGSGESRDGRGGALTDVREVTDIRAAIAAALGG